MSILNNEKIEEAESIEFSGWQVRRFLENRKSIYTIPIGIEKRGKPKKNFLGHWVWPKGEMGYQDEGIPKPREEDEIIYGREKIYDKDGKVAYKADGKEVNIRLCPYLDSDDTDELEWTFKNSSLTSGFMPKKYARLWFRVKSCFIPMKLHDVLKDYSAEMGVVTGIDGNTTTYTFDPEIDPEYTLMEAFKKVWDRGELSDNPWVWALKLERVI